MSFAMQPHLGENKLRAFQLSLGDYIPLLSLLGNTKRVDNKLG
jgi:hypothetical protein